MDYYLTTINFVENHEISRDEVYQKFEALKENGMIRVPKDYGMFVCRKD